MSAEVLLTYVNPYMEEGFRFERMWLLLAMMMDVHQPSLMTVSY
jgi:hypothetical protein